MPTGIALGIVGTIKMYAGVSLTGSTTEPIAGWLYCNGQAVDRTLFNKLFALIGTSYGVGDGSTTFNVPNLTSTFHRQGTPGVGGGASQVVLTASNLPSHTHTAAFNGAGSHSHSVVFDAEFHQHISGSYAASIASIALDSTSFAITDVEVSTGGTQLVSQPTAPGVGKPASVSHTHSASISLNEGHNHSFGSDATPAHAATTGSDGFGTALATDAHDNIPPFLYLNFLIKY